MNFRAPIAFPPTETVISPLSAGCLAFFANSVSAFSAMMVDCVEPNPP